MIVIAIGFIPLSPLTFVFESVQKLGKNIVQSACEKKSRKVWIGALATDEIEIMLKTAFVTKQLIPNLEM